MRLCCCKMDPMEIDDPPPRSHFHLKSKKTKRKKLESSNDSSEKDIEMDKEVTNLPKKRKKNIPKTVKEAVWNTYIGDSFGKIKCPLCRMNDITQMNFHCAHIIAEAEGGKTTIENLRPICASCNLSMGKMNLFDFQKKYFTQ